MSVELNRATVGKIVSVDMEGHPSWGTGKDCLTAYPELALVVFAAMDGEGNGVNVAFSGSDTVAFGEALIELGREQIYNDEQADVW